MLKRYSTFVSLFRSVSDILIISFIWLSAFYIRFYFGVFETVKGIPDFKRHLVLTLPVVLICYLSCVLAGLYKPKRVQNLFFLLGSIFKTSSICGLLVLAFFYYLQDMPYSRKMLALFIAMLFAGLLFSHFLITLIIRRLRVRGYNIRYYAVIGAGPKGQQLVHDIEQMDWLGLKCVFFVDNNSGRIGTELLGVPVYGPVEKLTELVKANSIDEIYLTLSGSEAQKSYPLLEQMQASGKTIRIIPDWGNLYSVSTMTIISIGSQVLFSAADSPLGGFNLLLKELFDRTAALILLVIFAIPMFFISVLIKLTSKGPVFYKQRRVGMDLKEFELLKFRTMKVGMETECQTNWTRRNDPRRTMIGSWLRRASLDELPQLINVIKGQMSLVGPRPEQPHFVGTFSEEYKKYMLRHKVKAGMTGWAQINGFRGDTSIRKRLLYDLYYVKNWSISLDLWILIKTPWHLLIGENAY